jgi:hypothetical protein
VPFGREVRLGGAHIHSASVSAPYILHFLVPLMGWAQSRRAGDVLRARLVQPNVANVSIMAERHHGRAALHP